MEEVKPNTYCKGIVTTGLFLRIHCLSCRKFTTYYVEKNLGHDVPKGSLVNPSECHYRKNYYFEKNKLDN